MSERPKKKERRLAQKKEEARLSQLAMRKQYARAARVGLTGLGAATAAVYAQTYNLHEVPILSSYGKDFLAPFVVAQCGQFWSSTAEILGARVPRFLTHSPRPYIAAALVYAFTFEAMQFQMKQMGLEDKTQGRYDPYDLVAATIGGVLAYKISTRINGDTTPLQAQPRKKK